MKRLAFFLSLVLCFHSRNFLHAGEVEEMLIKGNAHLRAGRLQEAESAMREALKSAAGEVRGRGLNNLAATLFAAGRYAEAESVYREALQEWAEYPTARAQLATTHLNLGEMLRVTKRYAEAEQQMKLGLAIRREVLGSDHAQVASAMNVLSCLFTTWGKAAEGERTALEALAMRTRLNLGEDLHFAVLLHNLAENYRLQKRWEEAETLLRRSVELRTKLEGPTQGTSDALGALGSILVQAGRTDEGLTILERAVAMHRKLTAPNAASLARLQNEVAVAHLKRGEFEHAQLWAQESVSAWQSAGTAVTPELAVALMNLAQAQSQSGRPGHAEPVLRRALSLLEQDQEPDVRLADCLMQLATLFIKQEKYTGAEKLLQRALNIRQMVNRSDEPAYLAAREALAGVFRMQRRYTEARKLETAGR